MGIRVREALGGTVRVKAQTRKGMGCYLEDSVWSRGSWFLGEVCLSAEL